MKIQTRMWLRSIMPLNSTSRLLILQYEDGIRDVPEVRPGQFVEVLTESREAFLRRPISINNYIAESGELWLAVKNVGPGTEALCSLKEGSIVDIILPLGKGFDMSDLKEGSCVVLVGGGIGIAPLLYLGEEIKRRGIEPTFVLGGRTVSDIIELEEFSALGTVHVTTEDGTMGEQGFVTNHSCFMNEQFDKIFCCGPLPMMKSVARLAREKEIACEVSLENKMACGLGACLCCVEDTKEGNRCVCTEGPVFNINDLRW